MCTVTAARRTRKSSAASKPATASSARQEFPEDSTPFPSVDRDWSAIAEELNSHEHEFIYNESFASAQAGAEIMAALPPQTEQADSTWKPGREVPSHLARLCESRLLKPAEEKALFCRMNYCKFQADRLRRRLDGRRPDPAKIRAVEEFLAQAQTDRDRIVRANLRLVISIARKFADTRHSFDDLLSEGIASLLRAAEKFDYDRGFRFSTYATQAVRRTLCRYIQTTSRDQTRFAAAETGLLENAPEVERQGALSEQRWELLRGAMHKLLGKLDPRERAIIRARFGLGQTEPVQTLQSLADEMGICKERVRQLELRAIAKLRSLAEKVPLVAEEN
jgi:RNA polymerase primary sigma factor